MTTSRDSMSRVGDKQKLMMLQCHERTGTALLFQNDLYKRNPLKENPLSNSGEKMYSDFILKKNLKYMKIVYILSHNNTVYITFPTRFNF